MHYGIHIISLQIKKILTTPEGEIIAISKARKTKVIETNKQCHPIIPLTMQQTNIS